MIRSFLAIELPKTILKKIEEVQEDLKASRADVRWVNPEKIHLTLKFFGNIEESQIDPMIESIREIVHQTPSFSLRVRGMGVFPHPRNPRVIWMGLEDGRDVIQPFQRQMEMAFGKIGFEPEKRRFQPHLTLGRVNSSRGRDELMGGMEKYKEQEFGELEVNRVILFKSDLRPSGPIYTPLGELQLGDTHEVRNA